MTVRAVAKNIEVTFNNVEYVVCENGFTVICMKDDSTDKITNSLYERIEILES